MNQHVAITVPEFEFPEPNDTQPVSDNLQKWVRRSVLWLGILILGLGGLAAFLPMSGAVIAQGEVAGTSQVQTISHPYGGITAAILVKEGDRVKAGQPLIRLNDDISRVNAQYSGQSLDQMLARAARLQAERNGSARISFPTELTSRAGDPAIAGLMQEEQANLSLRRRALASESSALQQRMRQSAAMMAGARSQLAALEKQSALVGQELEQMRALYADRYTTLARLNAVERSAVSVESSQASARASLAQSSAQIGELRAQSSGLVASSRSSAAAELTEVQAVIANIRRDAAAATDNFDRSVIRAPKAGVVSNLAYKNVGAVVAPGSEVLEIVPETQDFVIELEVPSSEIDEVREGRMATVRFNAFNARITPEVKGKVSYVAANSSINKLTGISSYKARVKISQSAMKELGNVKIRVGMPVEAFVQTGDRSMLSFITRPITEQLRHAFKSN